MFEEYKAFKEKVGVDDVAAYLGYKLDKICRVQYP